MKLNTLVKQYKNVLSGYSQFKQRREKEIEEETFVFPKNFGENMAIDETGLIDGELFTIVINKETKGKKGALAAIIKETKSSIITRSITNKVPYEKLVNIKEIILDLANKWINRFSGDEGSSPDDKKAHWRNNKLF